MSSRVWAAAAVVIALLVGLYLGGHSSDLPDPVQDVFVGPQAPTSADALVQIEDNYWRAVNGNQVQDESVRGMIDFLRQHYKDRFSHYFDPSQFKQFNEATSGQFSGVGMGVGPAKEGIRFCRSSPGSPAKAAGIKPGDVITAVDGRSIAGLGSELATGLVKGPAGTDVKLTIRPTGGGQPRVLTLRRANIQVPVVDGRIVHVNGVPVAYVRMVSFTPGVHGILRSEIEKLDRQGAKGLILDLRNNGGGLLDEAWLSGSIFVENGVVVSTRGRTQPSHVYNAVGDALQPRPTIVLINGNTASAAEILTAAMQEHHVATVVGTRSFGKGVYQQVIPLNDGGGLDLTVGEYFTPNGTSLAGNGIEPQVRAKDNTKTPQDEALARALQTLAPQLGK